MTSLTLLGAHGGAGTTTAAALTAVLLAERPEDRPAALAIDPVTFGARLGPALGTPGRRGHAIIDGARWTAARAASALDDGVLVIVASGTVPGDAAALPCLERSLTRADARARDRVWLLRTGAHGTVRRPSVTGDHVHALPFDRVLATVPSVATALPHVRRTTGAALSTWVDAVRRALG